MIQGIKLIRSVVNRPWESFHPISSSASLSNNFKPEKEVRIQLARGKGDVHELKYVFRQTFFKDEPSIKLLNLTGLENNGELMNTLLDEISYSESLLARDIDNGKLLGFALSGQFYPEQFQKDKERMLGKLKNPRNRSLVTLWGEIAKQFDYRIIMPNVAAMEVYYLGVIPEARGQKLGKRLMQASCLLAKEKGYGLVQVVCTNHQSAKICKSMGMTLATLVDYKTLIRPTDGRPISNYHPPPPNSHIHIYCSAV